MSSEYIKIGADIVLFFGNKFLKKKWNEFMANDIRKEQDCGEQKRILIGLEK